ncbi:PREDICTED: exportin-4-like [Papilio polytes]|uniref:exportin-4-like n=1 Tax=Papilio polytes TaxID=76194 RepID=UPI0006763C5B|nr:PREDICTED: exportin-4-like [Papilio polytes]
MSDSAIQTLESAAQILMAPPNLVSPEQRHQAESVFLEFRTTKNPYQLCREILEKSSSEYVLFEAAGLIKAGLIREWSLLSKEDTSSIREYLLNYLLRKENPAFVKERLLQTIAIIIKRGSVDDGGRERKALLAELEKIIVSPPISQQRLACSLILAIMQEFAITVKTADVGLIWEVHFRLKKSFETLNLKRIFRFTIGVLEQIIRSGHPPEGDQAMLTKQLITIIETILCWSHVSPLLSKRLIGAFEAIYESETAPALRLSMNWRDTIMKPELIALFFELHIYVRSNPDLANPSLTCLVQLASLSGVVVSASNLKQQYLEHYVNNFLRMLSFIQPNHREMLGISEIYRRLIQFFTPTLIAGTPPDFLQYLTTYTCHCIRGSIIEEGLNEDTVLREALNKFLHTWSSLVHDVDGYTTETLQNPCIEVFNTYLQCRLAPPDGTRGLEAKDGCDEDVKDDIEEDDRQLHNEVLMTIGAMARKAPAHCCHLLFTLLQDRSKRLESQLQLMHTGKVLVSGANQLSMLFEDLHWILMIIGHFLSTDGSGEARTEANVPLELMRYSIRENANVDASLRYLVGETTAHENIDPIIKLIGLIIRINEWECAALEAGFGGVLSPELSATVSWLLKVWANSYLMLDPADYTEMSSVIECAFRHESECASWAVRRLAGRARVVLRHLAAQPAAARHAVQLLAHLAYAYPNRNQLANCEEFVALVAWEVSGNNLPGSLRKELHKVFARLASYTEGAGRSCLVASTAALQQRLEALLGAEQDTEPLRAALADTLDCYCGIAEGMLEMSSMDEQVRMVLSALEKVPGVVFKYHNYAAVVLPALNLLAKSAKHAMHCQNQDTVNKFVDICHTTFEVYARWNSGKISSIPQDVEEEAYDDIIALMQLVRWLSCGAGGAGGGGCARGLRLLLPLVTPALLALPTLAHSAFRLLRDLEQADELTNLPIQDFNMVIAALRIGLTAVSSDVSTLCCETIVGLSNRAQTMGEDNRYSVALLSLAQLLLMLILKMEIPPDSIPAAGAAIYSLTCVRPSLLEGLARQVIDAFAANDPTNVPRLEDAFRLLTNGVLFDGYRPHKIRFQDNFDKFLSSVHGFLIVK